MAGTFRIGRLFGFEINVHWSWLFIFVLVTWTFATGILESAYPEWSAVQRWALATIIATIFFLSILLHEMSHSLLARRYGIPVSSITLFVFGGVSNLTKEPDNAREEFWIAIVGPLTSIAIGILFVVLFFALDPIDNGASDIAGNLALINMAIGVFNLVPGFPLDGGRVLRSVFWSRKRNILGATRIASNVGIAVAYIIMGIGIFTFFFAPVTGVWLLPDRQLPARCLLGELPAGLPRPRPERRACQLGRPSGLRGRLAGHVPDPACGRKRPGRAWALLPGHRGNGAHRPGYAERPQSSPSR